VRISALVRVVRHLYPCKRFILYFLIVANPYIPFGVNLFRGLKGVRGLRRTLGGAECVFFRGAPRVCLRSISCVVFWGFVLGLGCQR